MRSATGTRHARASSPASAPRRSSVTAAPTPAARLQVLQTSPAATDRADDVAVAPAVSGSGRGKCFACFCEDVTSKDIGLSIDEGYDSIELSKRYTTVTMARARAGCASCSRSG